jgi:hypothetical protein
METSSKGLTSTTHDMDGMCSTHSNQVLLFQNLSNVQSNHVSVVLTVGLYIYIRPFSKKLLFVVVF